MILGTYDSKTGIYTFNGHSYKPIHMANSLRADLDVLGLYNECIAGLDKNQWPHTVFVTYEQRWNVIKEHYPGLYAQSQLHYYWVGAIGHFPTWASAWAQSEFLLIHEYEAGKVAWMRNESSFANDIYMFMVDSAPPTEQPAPPSDGTTPDTDVVTGDYHVTGKIWLFDVDLHVTREE